MKMNGKYKNSKMSKADKIAGRRRVAISAVLWGALAGGTFAAFAQTEAPSEWKNWRGTTVVTGTLDEERTKERFAAEAEKPETVYFRGKDGKTYAFRYESLSSDDRTRIDVALGLAAEVVETRTGAETNSDVARDGAREGATSSSDWDGPHAAGTAKSLTIKKQVYKFQYCPAGSFTMGSPESENYRDSDETQHRVELTNGFWMLETEVTQAMWKSLMGSNPSFFSSSGRGASKVSGLDTSQFPVECVSWNDCQDFIAKLNFGGYAPSGFKFRLPTEAEWEYACRAGTTGPYAGSSLDSLGWYFGNSGNRPHAVGAKSANAWGLRDMHGNVFEWCEDCYDSKYYEKSNNAQNPINVTTGSDRVLRGGSWIIDAEYCRSANRNYGVPTFRGSDNGFRLALVRSSSSGK